MKLPRFDQAGFQPFQPPTTRLIRSIQNRIEELQTWEILFGWIGPQQEKKRVNAESRSGKSWGNLIGSRLLSKKTDKNRSLPFLVVVGKDREFFRKTGFKPGKSLLEADDWFILETRLKTIN